MYQKLIFIFVLTFSLLSCSQNKDIEYEINKDKVDPYKLYEEALDAFDKGDYFYAEKKFSESRPCKILSYHQVSTVIFSRHRRTGCSRGADPRNTAHAHRDRLYDSPCIYHPTAYLPEI